jgi:DNA-binding NarL/FixJ family response regulator
VISDLDFEAEARHAFDAGARGFLPTTMEPDVLLAALSFILRGGSYFPPQHTESSGWTGAEMQTDGERPAPRSRPVPGADPAYSLTSRQEDVLGLLSKGRSNKDIARALALSEATVKIHVRHLMKKLGVSNRTQVALIAARSRERRDGGTPRGLQAR